LASPTAAAKNSYRGILATERSVSIDTFAGLPEPTASDSAQFAGGDFMTSLQGLQNYLRDVDRQQFVYHQGYFPETAGPVVEERFSFVHLDADLYESTLSAL
jgi:O-methyltransferase